MKSSCMTEWPEEEMTAWIKDRTGGVQYHTGYGTVYVPVRNWADKIDLEKLWVWKK